MNESKWNGFNEWINNWHNNIWWDREIKRDNNNSRMRDDHTNK